ncbi:MAG: hypothetical protein KIS78_06535 [Labilithrix sp.]|nr:hypothetical protein [Labilithrix sp.]MCW5832094.1 hypothetical protein [Labilithrix sp.]
MTPSPERDTTARSLPARALRALSNSSFGLMVPVLLLNLACAGSLPPTYQPEVFWHDVPSALALTEHISRTAVTALPLAMSKSESRPRRRLGLALYGAGLVAYTAAWAALILAPRSGWSLHFVGFSAPASLPIVWLAGIGVASRARWRGVKPLFWLASALFLASHLGHTALVFSRLGGSGSGAGGAPAFHGARSSKSSARVRRVVLSREEDVRRSKIFRSIRPVATSICARAVVARVITRWQVPG